ncbi:MAG: hypothetical protein IJM34_06695 [Lachnospiraceae bacterium]|nr:hypothetical protein [Lachnospiraceae bacterium]
MDPHSGKEDNGINIELQCCGEILVLALPLKYELDGRIVYTHGYSASLAYLLCVIYIISTIITTFAYRKDMPGRRFTAMILWQGIF